MNPVACPGAARDRDLKPYAHAAWLPSLTRLHANEAPWRPRGRCDRRRTQSLSRAAAAGADRALGRALRRAGRAAARDARQRRGHRPVVAHLPARRHRCDFAMRAHLRHVPGGGAHPGRGGDRDSAGPRASGWRLDPEQAARRVAAAHQAGVSVLAEQSDRQSARSRRRSKRSARRSTARPSS